MKKKKSLKKSKKTFDEYNIYQPRILWSSNILILIVITHPWHTSFQTCVRSCIQIKTDWIQKMVQILISITPRFLLCVRLDCAINGKKISPMKHSRRLYKYNLKDEGKFYCLLFFMNMKLIISELFHLPLNVYKNKTVRMEIENRFSKYKFTYDIRQL